jgi:hypothetical protein
MDDLPVSEDSKSAFDVVFDDILRTSSVQKIERKDIKIVDS